MKISYNWLNLFKQCNMLLVDFHGNIWPTWEDIAHILDKHNQCACQGKDDIGEGLGTGVPECGRLAFRRVG